MNCDCDEKIIKKALDMVRTPEYNILQKVEGEIRCLRVHLGYKKIITFGLTVCLCFAISVGVMAAKIPSFNKLLYIVSPGIATQLSPVEVSSEYNGIKMEIVAAMNDDEMAVMYVKLQDLTGSRIDKTLDLYDYSLTGTSMFSSQLVDYDKVTDTATLRIEANGGEKLNGKKLSFSVDSFLSNKNLFNELDTGIKLADITDDNSVQTISLDMNDIPGGGGSLFDELKSRGNIRVLDRGKMKIMLPNVDFMYISNIGYIDNRLHIQTKWREENIDDHGFFYFTDLSDNKIDTSSANIYFGVDNAGNTQYGSDYVEYIFDMGDVNHNEVKLMGDFVSNGSFTKGKWKTTFKLQSVMEEKHMDTDIKFDTWHAEALSLSPMGITLTGTGEVDKSQQITASVNMSDEATLVLDSVRSYNEMGKVKIKILSPCPIDITKVKSIDINGTVVE